MPFDERKALRVLRETKRLQSPRLTLQRFSPDFVTEQYAAWMNDPEVRRGLVGVYDRPTTTADLADYVRSLLEDALQFAILHDGRHIGNIKVYDLERRDERIEIGYLIGERSLWGHGLATEAVSRVIQFCFEDLALHKVTSGCFADNKASERVLIKNGFALEGTLRNHFKLHGRFIDVHRFGKIASR